MNTHTHKHTVVPLWLNAEDSEGVQCRTWLTSGGGSLVDDSGIEMSLPMKGNGVTQGLTDKLGRIASTEI